MGTIRAASCLLLLLAATSFAMEEPKDGLDSLVKPGDGCDGSWEWRENMTNFEQCDSENTLLICLGQTYENNYKGKCECLSLQAILELKYGEFNPEEQDMVDAAIAMLDLAGLNINTTWDARQEKCAAMDNAFCLAKKFPTDSLNPLVKDVIDVVNRLDCVTGSQCVRLSERNEYVGYCQGSAGPSIPKSSFHWSNLPGLRDRSKRGGDSVESAPAFADFQEYQQCDDRNDHTFLGPCNSYDTFAFCHDTGGYNSYFSRCQCMGKNKLYAQFQDGIYRDLCYDWPCEDPGRSRELAALNATDFVIEQLQLTIEFSFDTLRGICAPGLSSPCAAAPFPTTGLRPGVSRILSSINKMPCASGLQCMRFSDQNPYLGFCEPPTGIMSARQRGGSVQGGGASALASLSLVALLFASLLSRFSHP